MEKTSQILNIVVGAISVLAILSGFLIKDYQIAFWSVGSALLVIASLSYYVFDNRNKINFLLSKFKKIEESLNIHNRLNKLELALQK